MSENQKMLRLYNTLTRSKEEFVPIDPENVRMYVCGPTVYDFAHIGNARPVIVFDVLFRLLRHLYGADHVTYVRNITDVDDKINARAARDFPGLPLNEAIRKVTEKTANRFHEDVAALGCLAPTHEPRATEFVLPRKDGKADMVTLIQRLIERGHAYESSGEVLFDTSSMADYGQLSKRNLDEQQAGARIAVEKHKKNPADFVLWKQSSQNEPGWDAAFQLDDRTVSIRGRPGWHIECSAMAEAYLGKIFDIHGGGLDLIFPHHENEIAQSRCAHGTDVMANVWMHNGFLQVEGQKMSKSLGNFVTIHDLLHTDKFGGTPWEPRIVRFAMLKTDYKQPVDWTLSSLQEARKNLLGLQQNYWTSPVAHQADFDPEGLDAEFVEILCNDLNTPSAIARLFSLSSEIHRLAHDPATLRMRVEFTNSLHLLGISRLDNFAHRGMGNQSVIDGAVLDSKMNARLALIAQKNWTEADRIRDELLAQGIQLKDGKDPVTGERVTTWEVKR